MSLGGVRDEAEIRGHRRTYIGALPGQIIQSMKKAGTKNPVIMLDEIDKMASDFRGDPASALLEVLDPEQNHTFQDHYLDVEYDLSQVLFVATANVLHTIPGPLQDRMEILRLTGYTELEKLEIAKQYLVRKQIEATGLTAAQISFSDDALREIIRSYTREAGVRNLEREIGNICRKVARKVVGDDKHVEAVTAESLSTLLGVAKYRDSRRAGEVGDWPGYWAGVDGDGRKHSADRSAGAGRQGQDDGDRAARRRDAGVGAGCADLHPLALASPWAAAGLLSQRRHPRACSRGRDSQGRAVGGHHAGDGAGERADQDRSAARHRHDRRDHAARQGAAHRRPQGEAAGSASRRNSRGDSSRGEQEDLADLPELIKNEMKLNWVEQMDEVLEIALVSKPLKLAEETPAALAQATPLPIPPPKPAENIAHQ